MCVYCVCAGLSPRKTDMMDAWSSHPNCRRKCLRPKNGKTKDHQKSDRSELKSDSAIRAKLLSEAMTTLLSNYVCDDFFLQCSFFPHQHSCDYLIVFFSGSMYLIWSKQNIFTAFFLHSCHISKCVCYI